MKRSGSANFSATAPLLNGQYDRLLALVTRWERERRELTPARRLTIGGQALNSPTDDRAGGSRSADAAGADIYPASGESERPKC